jgi:hypothetical protein
MDNDESNYNKQWVTFIYSYVRKDTTYITDLFNTSNIKIVYRTKNVLEHNLKKEQTNKLATNIKPVEYTN